ncbi:MAG: hypothetical protein HY820_26880 [Acidobacteria bacterium]|nr:hypothetical protein [Acidobacteriota bacterium]
MITCKQVSTLATSGELERQSAWTRLEIRFHLWMCKHCSRLVRQMRQMREAGRRLRSTFESESPAGGDSGLEVRVLAKLRNPPTGNDEQTH